MLEINLIPDKKSSFFQKCYQHKLIAIFICLSLLMHHWVNEAHRSLQKEIYQLHRILNQSAEASSREPNPLGQSPTAKIQFLKLLSKVLQSSEFHIRLQSANFHDGIFDIRGQVDSVDTLSVWLSSLSLFHKDIITIQSDKNNGQLFHVVLRL